METKVEEGEVERKKQAMLNTVVWMVMQIFHIMEVDKDYFTRNEVVPEDKGVLSRIGTYAEWYWQYRKALVKQICDYRGGEITYNDFIRWYDQAVRLLVERGRLAPLPCSIVHADTKLGQVFNAVKRARSEAGRKDVTSPECGGRNLAKNKK